MSLERIAEILSVDEVVINHGPKGVAVHVRVAREWRSAAIDNGELVKSRGHGDDRTDKRRRLETIAEHLAFLSDAHIGKVRDLRKAQADDAARAALWADREFASRARRELGLSWNDVGGFANPRDGAAQQQVVKAGALPPDSVAPEGPAAETMPSRFHAIMAELRCL